jgi:hypothetical protein
MYKLLELRTRLGKKRHDVFNGRQRIQDCLYNLIKTNFVNKNKEKYIFDYAEMHLYLMRENSQKELNEIIQSMKKKYEDLKQEIQNLDYNNIQIQELFNEAHGEDFLKNYLNEHINKK